MKFFWTKQDEERLKNWMAKSMVDNLALAGMRTWTQEKRGMNIYEVIHEAKRTGLGFRRRNRHDRVWGYVEPQYDEPFHQLHCADLMADDWELAVSQAQEIRDICLIQDKNYRLSRDSYRFEYDRPKLAREGDDLMIIVTREFGSGPPFLKPVPERVLVRLLFDGGGQKWLCEMLPKPKTHDEHKILPRCWRFNRATLTVEDRLALLEGRIDKILQSLRLDWHRPDADDGQRS